MLKIAAFLLGTILLATISRRALLQPRSHGFYRFFAWEVLLGLFVLNVETWFRDPFAWHQWISWTLLVSSLVLVLLGLRLLRQVGKPDKGRRDAALLGLEKTSQLVTVGLYRYIRHPLYSSLLCLGWGMFFKSPSWPETLLVLACTLFLIATARSEEHENILYFGPAYLEYRKHTWMFIPYVL